MPINKAYEECFENMAEFKKEDNFKRCLKKLDLSNVIEASVLKRLCRGIKKMDIFCTSIKVIAIIKKTLH
jgi:hypothetical protein